MTSSPPKAPRHKAREVPFYAELQITSNFSFLRGASHPDELVLQAATLGLDAIAVTDRNSVTGLVRAHTAAKEHDLRFIPASRLDLEDGSALLCYPTNRAAYGRMTRLLTLGKRRADKGDCRLGWADLLDRDGPFQAGREQILALVSPTIPNKDGFEGRLAHLRKRALAPVYLTASYRFDGVDARRLGYLASLAAQQDTPLLATGDIHAHHPTRRELQDVLTCIREGCTVFDAGHRLYPNGERYLRSPKAMALLFQGYEQAMGQTRDVVEACHFSLAELAYDYPIEAGQNGRSPQEELAVLTETGARSRYPAGVPEKVQAQIDHELNLIGEMQFAPYFLTVHDLVRFAKSRDILCQGRGSAANSAVCFCLGITSVDPARLDLLFERFVSAERDEPPDIDVDFENARREEVIQYVYDKYGRDRAGMTATLICYRSKGAIRDLARALGMREDMILALQGAYWRWSGEDVEEDRLREHGLDPDDPLVAKVRALLTDLIGFPRHLSQHPGGMVMTHSRLDEIVPIANAAMEDRTVIEWDKTDLDALGILKVDLLGLGMLTAVHKAFDLLRTFHGVDVDMASVPAEDACVYDMLCEGDSIGVFQVESRAQMSMLPRLKPKCFYDLVVEVAIVRPGPIQGDMVHPYLRRRDGLEQADYPSEELRDVLGKTLGVPLFQEQAMKIAITAAGFTPSQADALRRAMATFRNHGQIFRFQQLFVDGMLSRGYTADFAERCFKQIEGFADYGFPESHAASFALIVYVSAWLKRHYPAAFTCALLNSQPMGFYAPAQLVRDAVEHGVELRPVDVNFSEWDCTLEPGQGRSPALRLGFRQVKGLREEDMHSLALHRGNGYGDLASLRRRAGLSKPVLERLAKADALRSLDLTRRPGLWKIGGMPDAAPLPLFDDLDAVKEPDVTLPAMSLGQEVADDYRAMRLSLKSHPVGVLRDGLGARGYGPCSALETASHESRVSVAGLVTARQRPGTAKGVFFITLEDETGIGNLIVWPHVFEMFRKPVLGSRLLGVSGIVQREGKVIHLLVDKLEDMADLLMDLDCPTLDISTFTDRRGDEAAMSSDPGAPKRPNRQEQRRLFPARSFASGFG